MPHVGGRAYRDVWTNHQCFRWFWCRLTRCEVKRSSSGSARETGWKTWLLFFLSPHVKLQKMCQWVSVEEKLSSLVNLLLCMACIYIYIIYTVKYILCNTPHVRIMYNAHIIATQAYIFTYICIQVCWLIFFVSLEGPGITGQTSLWVSEAFSRLG